jgi:hypothetical protein
VVATTTNAFRTDEAEMHIAEVCQQMQTEAAAEEQVVQQAAEVCWCYRHSRRARLEVGRGRPVSNLESSK